MTLLFLLSCRLPLSVDKIDCVSSQDCANAFGSNTICNVATGFCEGCSSNSQCWTEYGTGYECKDADEESELEEWMEALEGTYLSCEPVSSTPRCNSSLPERVWENWSSYEDSYFIGQMFDGGLQADVVPDVAKISAADLAFQSLREQPWLDDKEVVVISCDYGNDDDNLIDGFSEADAVGTVTDYLVNRFGINVVVGPAGSGDVRAAYTIAQSEAVFISPSATSPDLSDIEDYSFSDETPGTIWRTVSSDELQAEVLSFAMSLHPEDNERVGIIYQSGLYGGAFKDILSQSLGLQGISYYAVEYEAGDQQNIEEALDTLLTDLSDVTKVAFISSDGNDIIEFIDEIDRDEGYANTRFYLTDSAAKDFVIDNISSILQNNEDLRTRIMGTKPALPQEDAPLYADFSTRLLADYNLEASKNVYAAYTYDAAWLAFLGIAWDHYNGTGRPQDIALGLRNISDQTQESLPLSTSGLVDILEAFEQGQSVNIVGASGELDYSSTTEEVQNAVELWTIDESIQIQTTHICDDSTEESCLEVNPDD